MTGFPGFLSTSIVKKLLARDRDVRFSFLVQQKFVDPAKKAIAGLQEAAPDAAGRMSWVVGDITRRNLGLGGSALKELLDETTEVWHLAAAYDLSVGEYVAYQVNVDGTKNVLDLCLGMGALKKLIYFSTCYVSGTREGVILESELEMGQSFKNHYEATKFKAEMIVREHMEKIPTVVIRPAIVIGDSRTGEAVKFDGPYPMIQMLAMLQRKRLLPKKGRLPVFGTGRSKMNFVPVDYLAEAVCELSGVAGAVGKTFQVCDPNPPAFGEFQERLYELFGLKAMGFGIPVAALGALLKIPGLKKLTAIDENFLPYAEYSAGYSDANLRETLEGRGIHCPDLREYLPMIVDFVKNRDGGFHKAMY